MTSHILGCIFVLLAQLSFSVIYIFLLSIYPVTNVIFTLSSISRGLLFLSVNHTSINENYVFMIFSIINGCGEILINCLNCLSGTNINNTFDACWQSFLTMLQCINTTSTDSNFGIFSQFLFFLMNILFFLLPNNLFVSSDNNARL